MSDPVKCRWPACEDETDCMNGCKPAPQPVAVAQAKPDSGTLTRYGLASKFQNICALKLSPGPEGEITGVGPASYEFADWLLSIASPAQSSWQPPEGFVMVPQAAIKWLHGEGPDDNGKWFGDAEPPIKPSMPIARYWWRTTFRRMCSVPSTHCGTIEAAAQRLVDELLAQHISRDKFTIGVGSGELHAYIQLARVDCRADIIDGWPVVWHFNVGPAVAHTSTNGNGAAS